MDSVIFIVGPTSVGKSSLALSLAEKIGGEIVNADAFQIYDGLELLTSKPNAETCRRVPHHLFGCVPLSETYNVARYLAEASACLEVIACRKHPAIVVGGTGLYVKALTHGLAPLPAPDLQLRARLEATELSILLEELRVVDPVAFGQVDTKNKRRVVRALEVTLTTGTPFSSYREDWSHTKYSDGGAGVFLDRERENLRERIDRHVDEMFDAGVVDEVRAIGAEPVGSTASGVIGLAEIREMLAGRLTPGECKEQIKTRTKQYAKRQITWFKREKIFRRMCVPRTSDPSDGLDATGLLPYVGS